MPSEINLKEIHEFIDQAITLAELYSSGENILITDSYTSFLKSIQSNGGRTDKYNVSVKAFIRNIIGVTFDLACQPLTDPTLPGNISPLRNVAMASKLSVEAVLTGEGYPKNPPNNNKILSQKVSQCIKTSALLDDTIPQAIQDDFYKLQKVAESESWNDNTPVPPNFFDPLKSN